MQISQFNIQIAKKEHKREQVNIAQISEISRVINDLTQGGYYKMIRGLPDKGSILSLQRFSRPFMILASTLLITSSVLLAIIVNQNSHMDRMEREINYLMDPVNMFVNGEGG